MKTTHTLLLASILLGASLARDVPTNLRAFYDAVKPGKCSGSDLLQPGFQDSGDNDPKDWSYCQQSVASTAIFLKGNGQFANMDIDCDGAQGGGDGRCASSGDTQDQTSFKDTVSSYGIPDLNANIHPYVVFGNDGSKPGYTTFDPTAHGIHPLSVMAVVCGDKLVYGIWGDTNGDDGPAVVGEASLATGTLCYGDVVNGNSGHDDADVLYIAFTGADAVPGKGGAKWDAGSTQEFEDSIAALGDRLVARIGGGGGSDGAGNGTALATGASSTLVTSTKPTATAAGCEWVGHCTGAACESDDDCSGSLTCGGGKCGK